ncbi:UNVERIFIED_CONTAM: LanC-like protein 2 [Trichonephila clavipes]
MKRIDFYGRKNIMKLKSDIDIALLCHCNFVKKMLENLERDVCAYASECPDELLYGRAGYLFSLLFLEKHLPAEEDDEVRQDIIKEVIKAILESGQYMSKKFKNTHGIPLFYEWHDKAYIGAAHGFSGILYMLLQAKKFLTEEQLDTLIRPTIDFIVSIQYPSGNFPSSIGSPTDRLVHWCHGAPGVVHLLLLAHETFPGESKYLESARRCSDVIWQRGLLKKGYGICHGVSGNGYAQLRLFQVTREAKYLYRAVKFKASQLDGVDKVEKMVMTLIQHLSVISKDYVVENNKKKPELIFVIGIHVII